MSAAASACEAGALILRAGALIGLISLILLQAAAEQGDPLGRVVQRPSSSTQGHR